MNLRRQLSLANYAASDIDQKITQRLTSLDKLISTVQPTLLHQVAQRFTKVVRKADTVARVGGDEFVVLLPSLEKPLIKMRLPWLKNSSKHWHPRLNWSPMHATWACRSA
jgi:GGDEF domain-containing protein